MHIGDMGWYSFQWKVQPRWVKRLTMFIGIPCWIAFAATIFMGTIFTHTAPTLIFFGGFGVVAVLQTFFIARALWRNEM